MSSDFIQRDSVWQVIQKVNFGEVESDKAVDSLFRIIRNGHGQLGMDGTYARFTPDLHSYLNYQSISSSIIKMNGGGQEYINPVVEKEFEMLCEFKVISNLTRRINNSLKSMDPGERTIFFRRRLYLEQTSELKDKFCLHNNKLYDILRLGNKLIKIEFNLELREKEYLMKKAIMAIQNDAKKHVK